ncbi:MAG: hypothetical protein ABIQ30_12870 [Devosia sp.]
MIAQDWQRIGWNLLLGPPIAYVVALIAVLVFLLAVGSPESASTLLGFIIVVGVPGALVSYVFGLLPGLLNGAVTSVLARFIKSRSWRLWTSLPAGIFSTWLGAGWVVGMSNGQFDSDYLKFLLSVTVPIGGAVASLACTALVERGSRKTTREGVI